MGKIIRINESHLIKLIGKLLKEVYDMDEVDNELVDYMSSNSNQRFILTHEDKINFTDKSDKQRVTYKPKGLWYGFGTSWIDWVRSEMPEWEKDYSNVFLLEINENSVLQLGSKSDLIEFTKKYSPSHNNSSGQIKDISYFEKNMIDWSLVSKDYSGIEINPYIYSARMNELTNWYYPWDVASGCIWNQDGIKSIKKVNI